MSTPEDLGSELVMYAARLVRVTARLAAHEAPAGLRLLSQLDELGPLTVTQLARADRSSQPTTSAAVTGLEQRGLLTREAHSEDARSTLLELTPTGRAVLRDARDRHGKLLGDLVAAEGIDPQSLQDTVDLLRHLTTALPEN